MFDNIPLFRGHTSLGKESAEALIARAGLFLGSKVSIGLSTKQDTRQPTLLTFEKKSEYAEMFASYLNTMFKTVELYNEKISLDLFRSLRV